MFNYIESSALMDVCRALGLDTQLITQEDVDVWIIPAGTFAASSEETGAVGYYGFKLSDYLLATAPVDVKEA